MGSIKLPFVQKRIFPLSLNKLYAWQRAYKENGLAGLIDKRGNKKESGVKELAIEPLVIELLESCRGGINIASLHNMLHMRLDSLGLFDYADYIAKKGEFISYHTLRRYVIQWKKKNPLKAKLILKGEDAAISSFMPAYGKSNCESPPLKKW